MTSRTRILILIPILIFTLSCQTVVHILQPPPTATSPPSPSINTLVPSHTANFQESVISPTITHTTSLHITSPPTPSPSRTKTAVPSPVFTPSQLQREIFEELWQIINNDYLYPDYNGLDWNAIHEEYLQRIEAGINDDDFYLSMDEMISRLGDDHSLFLSPEEAAEEDAQYAGNNNYVGIGILAIAVPERNRATVILTFPNSPAEHAGIQSHVNILAVDGEHIIDGDGFLRDIIRGPEGTNITLTVQTPGERPRQVTLTRRRILGAIPVPYQVIASAGGQRIGYILLATLSDSTIDEQVENALREMTKQNPLDGLILDNRQNDGGADTVLINTLSYFTNGTLGFFISRYEERPLHVEGRDAFGSQQIPLVVLIGIETVSYGEVMSGVLKDNERAYLIGETTEGNIETLWGYDFPDGSRAWIASESFRSYNHPTEDWEVTGIIPHKTIITNWDEITIDHDPAVDAALAYLDEH